MKQRYLHIGILFVSVGLLLGSCQLIKHHQEGDVVAEVNGKTLRQIDIAPIVAHCTNAEDSAKYAQAYINQWKKAILLYDNAQKAIGKDAQIEQLVENYRRALYIHAYEEWLVDNEMPKHISEDSIQAYYAAHPEDFILQETIVKGLFLVVPNDAPRLDRLRKYLRDVGIATSMTADSIDTDVLEHIEKYAYQNASGYELFTEKWQTLEDIRTRSNATRDVLEKQIRTKQIIEISDSVKTCFLRITDKRMRGEEMPIDYAQPDIEREILEKRKIEFLREIQ